MENSCEAELITLRGRIQTDGVRCTLLLPGDPEAILLRCPGLGPTLLRDTPGVRVSSGSPMVNVECELTGRYLAANAAEYRRVFGDVTKIVVFAESREPLPLEVSKLRELSPAQLEDCAFVERRDRDTTLREKYVKEREAW